MAEIPLNHGLVAVVDDEDAERVANFRWFAWWNTKARTYYAARGIAAVSSSTGKYQLVLMHRLLTDAPTGLVVHHRNHDGLDNRRGNLVVCTHAENTRHRRASRKVSKHSPFKGVGLRSGGRWEARIKAHGRQLHLGFFATEEDAARAYDRAAVLYFGEFALTNAELHGLR